MAATVKDCPVLKCNGDGMNPGNFSWKSGEDELPIVDHYTYLGVTSKDCSWDTPIAKITGTGKAHRGKMDTTIPTDSHLGARIKRCILMIVIVPKIVS